MEIFNSLENKVVFGHDLKKLELKFVKVTNEKENHYGLYYDIGENIDPNPLTYSPCSKGGIYFTPIECLGHWMNLGNGYREVTFSDDEEIFIESNKCKARRVFLGEKIFYDSINYPIAKQVIAINGGNISFLNDVIKNNEELCKLAIVQNVYNLQYASDAVKENIDICKYALRIDGEVLKYLSEKIKNNPELCKIAIKSNPYAVKYVGGPAFPLTP